QTPRAATPAYLSYAEAKTVFDALGERLPPAEEWPDWIAARHPDTRARVAEGDETSIVHWFLFGTSFTRAPRVTSRQLDARDVEGMLNARLGDFERAPRGGAHRERTATRRAVTVA